MGLGFEEHLPLVAERMGKSPRPRLYLVSGERLNVHAVSQSELLSCILPQRH
jgi:hypothetical protein